MHVEARPYFLQAKKGVWDEAMLQAGLDVAARNFGLKLNDKPLICEDVEAGMKNEQVGGDIEVCEEEGRKRKRRIQ